MSAEVDLGPGHTLVYYQSVPKDGAANQRKLLFQPVLTWKSSTCNHTNLRCGIFSALQKSEEKTGILWVLKLINH